MSRRFRYPEKKMLAMVVGMVMAAHATGCATPGYFAIPSISIDEVYDGNLFFASANKQSDFITRVSPALEVGYEADTLSWSGRYWFDAEAYAGETALNSSLVRQFADVNVEYLPTSRLTLSAAANYTKTDTPLDLTLIPGATIPGLLLGRADAERTSVHSAASYRLTKLTTGSLAFTRSNVELVDAGESEVSALETRFDQRLSEVNTLSYGYIHRQYRFDEFGFGGQAGPSLTREATEESNTPWIGLSHQFNARTRITARAGPRLVGESVDPYVLVSLQHRLTQGEVLLEYHRDETTLLGVPRKLELDALYATISRRIRPHLEVKLTPGYARLYQAGLSVDIYSFGLGAVYKINEAVFLTASYDFNLQDVRAVPGGASEISYNAIQVGVRFTYPRREPREPR